MMEKKKTFKNRICAGFLALTLAGAAPVLVKANEQIVTEAQEVNLEELFEVPYEIPEIDYDGIYEYKYANDDGKTEKWYFSYLPEIDGLKRTNEKKEKDYEALVATGDTCIIKEPHTHLYYSLNNRIFIPICNEKLVYEDKNGKFVKSNIITKVDPKLSEILLDYGYYRLVDNLLTFSKTLQNVNDSPATGLMYFIPRTIVNGEMETETIYINKEDCKYKNSMKNYLIEPISYGITQPEDEARQMIDGYIYRKNKSLEYTYKSLKKDSN